ncbi:class I SAM-dependent methyltransferase [Synechococcus sp. MIT S9451]|uniref:class I SAM-dependent methyltransferase n=1 Tax=Synechococcus sp. MIT S9451 TaxID=3082543 RepID=UPI0039B4AC80
MLKSISHCNVCGSSVKQVLDLPNLPLTGLYYPTLSLALESPTFDQGLSYCPSCGHCQLSNVIDPSIVYDDSYTHRTSHSPLSRNGNEFLFNYITNSVNLSASDIILEAGCNDCYLLQRLYDYDSLPQYFGFDPIWIDQSPSYRHLNVYGSFVEDIDKNIPDIQPTLVISAHTFEHVVDLKSSLALLVNRTAPDGRIIIEMPSFDTLIRLTRFDQVFHQHVQYISESSIQELASQLNCSLLNITYNYTYWGGTVIFDLQKTSPSSDQIRNNSIKHNESNIIESYKYFQNSIKSVENSLPDKSDVTYLGAAQMLPILNYHVKNTIQFNSILDDNPDRIGKYLPNLNLPILPLSTHSVSPSSPSSFVIGAVDSTRALISRSRELGFPNIFSFFNSSI